MTINIQTLKKSVENLFAESVKFDEKIEHNYIKLTVDGTYDAINWIHNTPEIVKVTHWFDDYWLFMQFRIVIEKVNKKNNSIIPKDFCISLSVFHGKYDEDKHQLFRAEWDDYNDENQQHAQPHWHITSNQAIENSFVKYTDTFEKQEFIDLLQSEKQKVFDVKKIHFAMNGDWQNNNNHVNKIETEQQVVNWLQGMLSHLRTELKS